MSFIERALEQQGQPYVFGGGKPIEPFDFDVSDLPCGICGAPSVTVDRAGGGPRCDGHKSQPAP